MNFLCSSGSDSESCDYFIKGGAHEDVKPRKSRNRSSFDQGLGLLASNPILFAKNQQDRVASLSRKIYSYLHSARHLVSQNISETGLFRRRALSDNLCPPSDSSIIETSDDAGHFSDAQDYPGLESHSGASRTGPGYRLRSGSCDALGHQANTSNAVIGEQSQRLVANSAPRPITVSTGDLKPRNLEDCGYIEDVESDFDPSYPRRPISRSSEFFYHQSVANSPDGKVTGDVEVSNQLVRSRVHRLRRRSSLDRVSFRIVIGIVCLPTQYFELNFTIIATCL